MNSQLTGAGAQNPIEMPGSQERRIFGIASAVRLQVARLRAYLGIGPDFVTTCGVVLTMFPQPVRILRANRDGRHGCIPVSWLQ